MYNESLIIADTLDTLYGYLSKFSSDTGASVELIFCDDGSKDGSGDIVRKAVREKSMDKIDVKVTGYADNKGKGSAVRHSVLASSGDIVIYTDSDLAYGVDVIKNAFDNICANENTDVLIGSRNISKDGYEGYTFLRKLMSKTYIKFLNIAAGFKLSDSQCGFKALRGNCARHVFSKCENNGWAFDIEMLMIALKCGYKISEMPVKIINHRESKIRIIQDTLKMLSDIKIIKKHVKKLEV